MTFAQHLDRLLVPTPPPSGWSMPDTDQHAWFIEACALPSPQERPQAQTISVKPTLHLVPSGDEGDGPPLRPQGIPNQPRLTVWNDTQRHALDVLSDLGASVHRHMSFEVVRSEWRKLARSLHPDSAPNGGRPQAFAQAAEAWDMLKSGPLVVDDTGVFEAGLR
ncbi:MAG: hypothetical protein ACJATT_001898 [Myxococcota bacterium]|jgi:hypothetical protein